MHSREKVAEAYVLAGHGSTASTIARAIGVPRSTVREWLSGSRADPRLGRPPCERCGATSHGFDRLPPAYAYLFGLYLGDGCISEHARAVFRLRVHLDLRYPLIIEACEAAIHEVIPGPKVGRRNCRGHYVATRISRT